MHFVYDIDIIVSVGHVNYITSRALNVRGPIERATLKLHDYEGLLLVLKDVLP